MTFGARKSASSRAYAIQPARNCLKTSDSPAKALSPSRQSEACTWQELPIIVWSGLAMKVIAQPCRWAISFAPFLKITWLSAAVTAGPYRKLISCWPGQASPFELSTGSPASYIEFRISRISGSS